MRRHRPEPSMTSGICEGCGRGCDVVVSEDSFDYSYGSINGVEYTYDEVSSCCGDSVVAGGETLVSDTVQRANKDHGPNIKKGTVYRKKVWHLWKKDGPSWYIVEKSPVQQKIPTPATVI